MTEPKDQTQLKLRDWPIFRVSPSKGGRKTFDGRPFPRISDLMMSHVPGVASEKLAWLQAQKSIGKLDGDDPDEIAEAEALLLMLVRLSGSKGREQQRHLDELLDESLKGTFPASDPVSIGNFTSTEPPSRPIDREVVDLSIRATMKGQRKHASVKRYG